MFSPKNIYTFASATLLFAAVPGSASAAIIQQTFSDYRGTFDSVLLPIGGKQVPTGTIAARQNPNLPSVVTFDTDTNTAIYALNFLLDFPLLTTLGLQSIPTAPLVTGSYTVDGQDLIADISGTGTVTGSSPFAGTNTFFQVRWRVTSPLNTSVYLGLIESEIVDICPSPSTCVQTRGVGEAFLRSTSVPEPSFLFSFFVLGTLGAASILKSKNKSSSSLEKEL
jgi:hypothetical protein